MTNYRDFIKYIFQLEKFYSTFAEVAKRQCLVLDFFGTEGFPCSSQSEPLSFPEVENIYRNYLSPGCKLLYFTIMEDDADLQITLQSLTAAKSVDVAFNFVAPDAFLGQVAVKIYDKWFAIGECINHNVASPYNSSGECFQESGSICITKLWSPFYVLSRIDRMEVELDFVKKLKKSVVCCLDLFL